MEHQSTETETKNRGGRGKFMRRGLLALTAGVAASMAPKWMAKPVLAANNDPITVGNSFTGTNPTVLQGGVSSGNGLLRLVNDQGKTLYATVTAGAHNAIRAEAQSGTAIYAEAVSNAGIWGN